MADVIDEGPAHRSLWPAAIAAALGASVILVAVMTGVSEPVDAAVFTALREIFRALPEPAREAVRDVTALGSFSVLGLMVAFASTYLLAVRRGDLALGLVAWALGSTVFSQTMKHLVERARPALDMPDARVFSLSFPSGHALLSAAIILSMTGLLALAAKNRQERHVLIAAGGFLTVAIGISRVLLGVHWPSDVLAGWLYGLALACAAIEVLRRRPTG